MCVGLEETRGKVRENVIKVSEVARTGPRGSVAALAVPFTATRTTSLPRVSAGISTTVPQAESTVTVKSARRAPCAAAPTATATVDFVPAASSSTVASVPPPISETLPGTVRVDGPITVVPAASLTTPPPAAPICASAEIS